MTETVIQSNPLIPLLPTLNSAWATSFRLGVWGPADQRKSFGTPMVVSYLPRGRERRIKTGAALRRLITLACLSKSSGDDASDFVWW
ncbi:Hypothetical protein, putative [Bodo saltans]|uniref:Ig-like domain-containing protein n=1 Tax=Bodo saltans TaxID=75058 RepID=A0A0S4J4S7_BODSA|nr:Hypothetical protein, putative [Bodo saltans]|eukprot:CUG80916.1 Hypothetical protein, putative [Bodo saltans]